MPKRHNCAPRCSTDQAPDRKTCRARGFLIGPFLAVSFLIGHFLAAKLRPGQWLVTLVLSTIQLSVSAQLYGKIIMSRPWRTYDSLKCNPGTML